MAIAYVFVKNELGFEDWVLDRLEDDPPLMRYFGKMDEIARRAASLRLNNYKIRLNVSPSQQREVPIVLGFEQRQRTCIKYRAPNNEERRRFKMLLEKYSAEASKAE